MSRCPNPVWSSLPRSLLGFGIRVSWSGELGSSDGLWLDFGWQPRPLGDYTRCCFGQRSFFFYLFYAVSCKLLKLVNFRACATGAPNENLPYCARTQNHQSFGSWSWSYTGSSLHYNSILYLKHLVQGTFLLELSSCGVETEISNTVTQELMHGLIGTSKHLTRPVIVGID